MFSDSPSSESKTFKQISCENNSSASNEENKLMPNNYSVEECENEYAKFYEQDVRVPHLKIDKLKHKFLKDCLEKSVNFLSR